ncbi:transglutaminase domain-containing protein [Sulfurimonas paralvinellae]|uniref:DUF805 domain-containing protein n=1 Tax=Sulfurimonas paralvinellae TaxID=317658 RepID=A0A7M1BA98_9BACT|nr:transglutaminase domain-containing protein [Sulfurimonas paralvinellae]QOP45672.1 DUF805 domain-containing protein [Sulfurimonas paralvinellae]
MKTPTLYIALFFCEAIPAFMVSNDIYAGNSIITAAILFLLAASLLLSWFFAEKHAKTIKNIGYIGMLIGIAFSVRYFMNYNSDIGILIVSLSVITGVNISLRERRMLAYLLIFSFLLFLYASSIISNKYSVVSIILFTFSFLTVVVAEYYTARLQLHTAYNYKTNTHFFGTTFTLLIVVSILTALLYYLLPQPKAIHYGILPFGGKKEYKGVSGESNTKNKDHKERVTDLPSYTKDGSTTAHSSLTLPFHSNMKHSTASLKTDQEHNIIFERKLKEKNKRAYYSSIRDGSSKSSNRILFKVKGKEARFLRGETYASFNGKSWKKVLTKMYTIQRNSRDYYDYWNGKKWQKRTRPFKPNEFYYNEYFTKQSDNYTITVKGKLSGKPIIYTPEGLLRLQFPSDTFYEDAARTIYAPSQLETGTYYTACVERDKYYRHDVISYADVWYKKAYSRPGYHSDPKIYKLARYITKRGDNSFEKAQSIINYFKMNYFYQHASINSPIQNQTLSEMLFKTKTGNALQFNSALVIMLRSTGEYARLVTGYAPGEYNLATHSYLIESKNKAVWTEVFVKGIGWVSFHAADDIPFKGEKTDKKIEERLLTKTQLIPLVVIFFSFLVVFLYYARKYFWTYTAKNRIEKHAQKNNVDFVIAAYKEVEKYYSHFHKGQKANFTLQEYARYIQTLMPENSYLIEYISFYSNQAIYNGEVDIDFDKSRYLEAALFLVNMPFDLEPFDIFIARKFFKYKNIDQDNVIRRYFLTNSTIDRGTFFRRSLMINTLGVLSFLIGIVMILFKINPFEPISYAMALIIILLCTYSMVVLSIKRLKDMGKSGWWSILLFIPYISFVFYIVLLFSKGKINAS